MKNKSSLLFLGTMFLAGTLSINAYAKENSHYTIALDSTSQKSIENCLLDNMQYNHILNTNRNAPSLLDTIKETAQFIQKGDFAPAIISPEKIDDSTYLYSNILVQIENYDPTSIEPQKVNLIYRNLSDIELKTLHISSSLDNISSIPAQILERKADLIDCILIQNQDITAPDINLIADTINVEAGSVWQDDLVVESITDDIDSTVQYEIDGYIDTNCIGTYPVTITAMDTSGNTSVETALVNVESFYQRIANAAIAQVGVNQDCTMLVTNALASVGINFHGWPIDYACLGYWTSDPIPGDIIIYEGHVAIYIGDGQAVHGGWLGYTTVVSSVNCSNAPIRYIHVVH